MCGICCFIVANNLSEHFQGDDDATTLLQNRGPDSSNHILCNFTKTVDGHFYGSVLHLRGRSLVNQPLKDDCGNILLWNGEIFGGIEIAEQNDTVWLSGLLKSCNKPQQVADILAKVHGPWAVIYYQKTLNRLWFGRDVFGRRSLLWKLPESCEDAFIISSTAWRKKNYPQTANDCWQEVPAEGIFYIDFKNSVVTEKPQLHQFIWKSESNSKDRCWSSELVTVSYAGDITSPVLCDLNTATPTELILKEFYERNAVIALEDTSILKLDTFTFEHCHQTADQFLEILGHAVKVQIESRPSLCKKCFGNIHCMPIDLEESSIRCFNNEYGSANNSVQSVHDKGCGMITADNELSTRAELSQTCPHAKVAILFSGGVDSTVIAALTNRFMPDNEPIDLLNVAFECRKDKVSHKKKYREKIAASDIAKYPAASDPYMVPDRISGLQALEELRAFKPHRKWNFVEINVTAEELQTERDLRIAHLVYPATTVLDDSIGCAIWFAARGVGILRNGDNLEKYTSLAKVVLVGMGADEQLAGYSRHRLQFQKHGWKGLINEIKMEIGRISIRNMGRDDRIISDHGRESRLPFLDESVVSFLNNLPIWFKANLNLPRGVGEKFLLRLVAHKLGLTDTATLAKRAIQFGSRIAKIQCSKDKGSDVCRSYEKTFL